MPHEVRRFRDGDLTMAYEVHGTGPRTLLYLHGLLLDAAVNRRLARDLAEHGNRVVLLDLPGHGASDRPRRAAVHRMDAYARRALHLLDELQVDRAVVGGMSLGADVALQLAELAPERLAGMVIEMPVLENATPFAALVFAPLLSLAYYAKPLLRATASLARRIPRHRLGWLDQVYGPLLLDPEELMSVIHGVLVGPVAPTADQRRAMTMPALVIGHGADRLHPLDDARMLARQLPNARLVEARSMFELRLAPTRITTEIVAFLDEVWAAEEAAAGSGDGSAVGI
ncbi:MAG TPA: alpha/beta fold hydrolase [Acidimicrobiales bacterium]|nr:alpha/beta fold hydrolase [Acidimicrobiales bacterium]